MRNIDWSRYANSVASEYPIKVPNVANLRKYFLPPCLSVNAARVGADNKSNIEEIAKSALYQKSDSPPSITSHCEKYNRKLIRTNEFAKS